MPFKDPIIRKVYDTEYRNRPDVRAKRKAKQREWRKANAEHLAKRGAKRLLEKRGMALVASARTRACKRRIEFNLDQHIDSIQQRIDIGLCELSGIPFDLSPGRTFASPSLDRINPDKGYVYTNIRVICHAMNVALGDWGEDALRQVMSQWLVTPSSRKSRRCSSGRTGK